ncbi:MAG: hypothetical protein Edafosvirus12_27 [Edafosvirus sp.]|uniref:Uncharacterized protein n=1 Tax=Edafosvirus sp. TaxID=2487765 RepID=A0A3G4ZU49_9VIRU|nr:MAG: hypothetical protein Edafosvirus12_27 [Edafosvirus sp.]
MNKILIFLFVCYVYGYPYVDFCSEHNSCEAKILFDSLGNQYYPIKYWSTVNHRIAKNNFLFNVEINVNISAELRDKNNYKSVNTLEIKNITNDICDEGECWLLVNNKSYYPLIDPKIFSDLTIVNSNAYINFGITFGYKRDDQQNNQSDIYFHLQICMGNYKGYCLNKKNDETIIFSLL